MTAASDYREMLETELAAVRRGSDKDISAILDETWLDGQQNPRDWTASERASMLVWAGLGMLAFGRLDDAEETLSIIHERPDVVNVRACRYYMSALKRLLPWPSNLSPLAEPERAMEWLRSHRAQLLWSEELGCFIEDSAPAARTLSPR